MLAKLQVKRISVVLGVLEIRVGPKGNVRMFGNFQSPCVQQIIGYPGDTIVPDKR
jgi:hypothetical protein